MSYTISEIMTACEKSQFTKKMCEILISNLPQKRSGQENKALHVLFEQIAFELNNIGQTFLYKGLKGIEIECKYTAIIVKELIWKPLQNALLEKQSTTELTNKDIQLIFDILAKWFSDKGIVIEFPNNEKL